LPKRASKARDAASVLERLPKAALPECAADSWVKKQRAKSANEDDDAKVIRAVRSILNKLTIEKFESLFGQLVASGMRSPDHISMLMSELFEKATTQHHFIPMYAGLCVKLARNQQIASAAGNLHDFRRLLLNQCQHVFEQLLEPRTAEILGEEDPVQHKKRALGNIKLIGELLVQGMLSSSLLVECGNMLLESRTQCPDALECLAALLMVAGEKFDTEAWQDHTSLEEIFSGMDKLTLDKSTPPRVRFLLRDVLDVRSAGWRTSANQTALKAAPMKLEEVREKQALEELPSASQKKGTFGQGKPRVAVAEAFQKPFCRSSVHRNHDNKAPCSPQRQRACTDPSSSLARLSAIATKPSASTWAPSRSRPDEKRSCNKAQTMQSKANLFEKQPVPQVSVPLTARVEGFDLVAFRRELANTLTKLSVDRNVPSAVQSIRALQVPLELQTDQFVDILSRILEEKRGVVRRCELAFAVGLIASDQSPFEKKACLAGIGLFFQDVYEEMCTEVPRLPAIIKSEFVSLMCGVFSAVELDALLPRDLRIA